MTEAAYRVIPVGDLDGDTYPTIAVAIAKLSTAQRKAARYPTVDELYEAIGEIADELAEAVEPPRSKRRSWRIDLFGLSIVVQSDRTGVRCTIPAESADPVRLQRFASSLARVAGPQIVLNDSDDDDYQLVTAPTPRRKRRP